MDELIIKISKIPMVQRVAALAGIVILILGGSYMLLVSPLQDEITKSEGELRKLESSLEKKQAIADNLTRYKIEVERLKQRLNEALTLLPDDAEIPELLQKIATLVEQSDCLMSTFEPQPEAVEGFYAKIPVKMAVRGNYHSVAVLFDKISKLARIVNVNDIKMEEPKIENSKVIVGVDFTATTFKFVNNNAKQTNTTGFDAAPQ